MVGLLTGPPENPRRNHQLIKLLARMVVYMFTRLMLDVQSKLFEISYHLKRLRPHVVFLQGTWLDESAEDIPLVNYVCILVEICQTQRIVEASSRMPVMI